MLSVPDTSGSVTDVPWSQKLQDGELLSYCENSFRGTNNIYINKSATLYEVKEIQTFYCHSYICNVNSVIREIYTTFVCFFFRQKSKKKERKKLEVCASKFFRKTTWPRSGIQAWIRPIPTRQVWLPFFKRTVSVNLYSLTDPPILFQTQIRKGVGLLLGKPRTSTVLIRIVSR